jgi:hypothetical protein
MSGTLLADVIQALDLFAMERMPNSSFDAITQPPEWLAPTFDASVQEPKTLAQMFPFLDAFLSDAEVFWHEGTEQRLMSGLFVAAGPAGDVLVRASALNLGARQIMVLERFQGEADTRPLLQKARENKLEYERLARRIADAQKTIATVTRLTRELLGTDLTTAQRTTVEALAAQLKSLSL